MNTGTHLPGWRLVLLSLLLCTTWMGCSDDPEPTPDGGTVVDAGTDSGTDPVDSGTDAGTDAGADAGPPEGTVRIRRYYRYRTASGVEELPADFTQDPVELFVLDGDNLVPVTGAASGPGLYDFPNVPPNTTYYAKVDTSFVVTDARSLDLSVNILGRADAGVATLPDGGSHLANVDLSGLEPWRIASPFSNANPSTSIQVVSGEVDFVADVTPDTAQNGDVRVRQEGLVFGNGVLGPMPVFDAARGDRVWVLQASPRDLGPLPDGGVQRYRTTVRAAHLPPFSYDGTAPFPLQATLEELPMNELPLDWRISEFAALAQEVHPGATPNTSSFRLQPAAHGPPEGWVGWSGELLALIRPSRETSNVQATLRYGNPFPSNWGLVGSALTSFRLPFRFPDEPVIIPTATISINDHASSLAVGPIAPRIRPPRALMLDGTSGYENRTLSLAPHVVTWQPPATGTPDAYSVRLRYMARLDENSTISRNAVSISLDGSATSVRLPSNVLNPGEDYYLIVEAINAPGYEVSDRPLMRSDRAVLAHAQTVSGLLSVPDAGP